MFARQAEQHQAEAAGAATRGPAVKQLCEEVEQLFEQLQGYGAAETPDEPAACRHVCEEELEAAIARALALQARVDRLRGRAMETDPDRQVYGPAMRERILQMAATHDRMRVLGIELQERFASKFENARCRKEEQARQEEVRREEEARAAARAAEEERCRHKRLEEEAQREAAELRQASLQLEEERRRYAQARLEEARDRERQLAMAASHGAHEAPLARPRFIADPVAEGDEMLTIEMAIQMEEEARLRFNRFREACQRVASQNSQQDMNNASLLLRHYLNNIVRNPRSRQFRTISLQNPHYMSRIDRLVGGRETMLAMGFEEEGPDSDDEFQGVGDAGPNEREAGGAGTVNEAGAGRTGAGGMQTAVDGGGPAAEQSIWGRLVLNRLALDEVRAMASFLGGARPTGT